jgi:hypothetical protein
MLQSFFLKLLFIYFFLYKNILGSLHDFIFSGISENFACWDFSSLKGISFVFITFLNIDNIVLLLHILVNKVGVCLLFSQNWDYIFLNVGCYWANIYSDLKLNKADFSFIVYFIDHTYNDLLNSTLVIHDGYFFSGNPLFFFFGILFFSTVIFS